MLEKKIIVPVVVTQGQNTWYIDHNTCIMLFTCNHEEADYRMVHHASLEDTTCIVKSKDTDVLMLLAYEYAKIKPESNWYMLYDNDNYADIKQITSHLGNDISLSLPQFHSVTGCDTTSYFFNHGKVSIFKKILSNPFHVELIKEIGSEPVLADEFVNNTVKFVQTVIYSGFHNESYVETRVRLYKRQKNKSSLHIPPDPDSC